MSDMERTLDDGETLPGLAEAIRFQRDLYLYWRTARALGSLPLTTRRYVTRPTVRRLRAALALDPDLPLTEADAGRAEAEDPRLFFLRRLLERMTLLRLSDDGTRLEPGPDGEIARFATLPLATRIRTCARLWVAGGWWPDKPDPRAEPPRTRLPAPPRLALARRRLLERLSALEPGDLVPVPRPSTPSPGAQNPPRTAVPRLRVLPSDTSTSGSSYLAQIPSDDVATVRAALDGPLRWLGLVALGSDEAQSETPRAGVAILAIRATPAAEGSESALEDPPYMFPREVAGRVVIQPDASVIAFPPLTAPTLALLDRCADEVALNTTARYRLSEPALARALRRGWDVSRVVAELETLSGAPLPGNIAVSLADWARRSERIRLLPDAIVLELPRPELLDALQREAFAREWIERRLTPTAALLRPEAVGAVRAWLLRRGEFPALTSSLPPHAETAEPTS